MRDRHAHAIDAQTRRFIRFLAVGGLNTLVGYAIFALFLALGVPAPLAAAGSTLFGLLFNFQSFGRLVFDDVNRRLLPRFFAVYAVQYVLNVGLLRFGALLGLGPLLAQALIAPLLALIVFFLMSRLVFNRTAIHS